MFALALSRDMGTLSWVNYLGADSIALDGRNKFLFLAKNFYFGFRDLIWVLNLAAVYHDTSVA